MTTAQIFLFTWALLGMFALAGRLVTSALRVRWLDRLTPGSVAAAAVSGAAVLTLGATWLSRGGLRSPLVALALGAGLAGIAAFTASRRPRWGTPRGAAGEWRALLGPAALVTVVALLPVLRTQGYSIGNDTFTYCAYAEWLQRNGFGTACRWEADSPVTYFPWLWQQLHYDLGIAHLVALGQALARSPSCLLVYPAVAAAGVVLLWAGVFLVARWVLRLSVTATTWLGLVFALVPHPSYWGHHNG